MEVDDDSMFDIVSIVQDVVVNLILVDSEITKNFTNLQSPDIWITNTGSSNDRTSHNKGIINLRKDESSSGMM